MYEKYTIGECEFSIAPLDPFKALNLLGRLQKIVMPALGKGLGAGNGIVDSELTELLGNGNVEKLSGAIAELSTSLDGDVVEKLSRELLLSGKVSVSISGSDAERLTEGLINTIFTQNVSALFMLLARILQVNYSDFFTSLGGLFGKAKTALVVKKG